MLNTKPTKMAVISPTTTSIYPSLSSLHSLNYGTIKNDHHIIQTKSRYTKLFTCSSTSKHSNYEAEESRWLREEQRWLREEQRWLREEARWKAERSSLLLQIEHLQSELECIRGRSDVGFDVDASVSDALSKVANVLHGGVGSNRISDKLELEMETSVGTVGAPPVTPMESESESEEEEMPKVEEKKEEKPKVEEKRRVVVSSLRVGAEGYEVQALQEALMNLGFYSGEEDMEYSSFSGDTERAVKTWQASIGVREDGIMTAELLERLYGPQKIQGSESSVNADVRKVDQANGAVAGAMDIQQAAVKKGPTDVDISQQRVFLLGENRWEDPSRLNKGNDKQDSKVYGRVSGTNCVTCRGEGRLLCMECDGTGEPNVEEQFLEWVDGEAKCPYCDGRGYNVCDVCEGKPVS